MKIFRKRCCIKIKKIVPSKPYFCGTGIANVNNRNVTDNINKNIGGKNLRTSDLFYAEVGFLETGTETKQTIGFMDETF